MSTTGKLYSISSDELVKRLKLKLTSLPNDQDHTEKPSGGKSEPNLDKAKPHSKDCKL